MASSPAPGTTSNADSGTVPGWQLLRAGHLAEALRLFDSSLATAPDDYEALLGRGRCHRLLGAYDDAIADFTLAHQLRASAARPLLERGAISILIGRYDESRVDYEAAAILEPAYPGLASYFAELCLYTGRPDEALAISEQACRDEPSSMMNRLNVAHAHLLLGDVERAADAYTSVAKLYSIQRRMTGAAIALQDLALMRAANIEAPGMLDIERRLRAFERDDGP